MIPPESSLEEFKTSSQLLLPAYVVIFDLADTKRRSIYLGHRGVDKDIIAFDNLLKNCVSSQRCKRFEGDKWVACIAEQQLNDISALIANYAQEIPISAGWECRASDPHGNQIFIEEKRNVSIARAVRCGYLWAENANELIIKVNKLVDRVHRLPVNTFTSLESEVVVNSPKWRCVPAEILSLTEYCPYCNGTNFDWSGGADDCSEGTCTQCGTEVDFGYC
jgi:GGDEF domain-containing protein